MNLAGRRSRQLVRRVASQVGVMLFAISIYGSPRSARGARDGAWFHLDNLGDRRSSGCRLKPNSRPIPSLSSGSLRCASGSISGGGCVRTIRWGKVAKASTSGGFRPSQDTSVLLHAGRWAKSRSRVARSGYEDPNSAGGVRPADQSKGARAAGSRAASSRRRLTASASRGRANRKPWRVSTFSAVSCTRWPSFSTPSATVSSPSALPS